MSDSQDPSSREAGGRTKIQLPLAAALAYLQQGFRCIPIPLGEKGPRTRGWQDLRLDEDGLRKAFGDEPKNVGLLLGEPSGWLTDVDLDCPETVQLASEFLPHTSRISGRASKPRSHYWYVCQGAESQRFKGPDGTMLVEIRSTGSQTVVPPSMHPDGEPYVWEESGSPANLDCESLSRSVTLLASSALLARVWPKEGSRHHAVLAVAGFLLRGGCSQEITSKIIVAAARAAGDDEYTARLKDVETTAAKIAAGEPATGGPTAAKFIGEETLNQLREWLNLRQPDDSTGDNTGPGRGPTQASLLVKMAERMELFHSPAGEAFATLEVAGHQETHPIRGKGFRGHLARMFYANYGKVPGSQALQDCLGVLEGKACHDGPEHRIFVRVGEHGEAFYLDLANPTWSAVRVVQEGWAIDPRPPVKFRRSRGMLALPEPILGGRVDDLRPFVNSRSDESWALMVAWLLAALRPSGPYPILALHGEQGCGKSTTTRALRDLIDPNEAGLRSQPREERDLVIAANNSWILALDNMSGMTADFSDALCRMATGGGFATRQLYSDLEETIFKFQRPCILNGIEEVGTRSDLLDRSILLSLPAIQGLSRRPEADFWRDYESARPRILGALLTAVSAAMRGLPSVHLTERPRMADFAAWAMAGEEALGLTPEAFLSAYSLNRDEGHSLAVEASPVAKAVCEFLKDKDRWSGTASDLAMHLRAEGQDARNWPRDARAMSGQLRRLAPNLRVMGIEIRFDKADRNTRRITLSKVPRSVA